MVDSKKVVKGLECCSDMTVKRRHKCLKECPYDFIHNDNCMGDMARDALELLNEQPKQRFFVDSDGKITPLPIQPQWISVKDRLPKVYNEYLAVVDDEVEEVTFNPTLMEKQPWSHCIAEGFEFLKNDSITYWMPLPKPPEEVKPDADEV